jgi:hypothetical protein
MERSIGHLSLSHRESSMASIRQKNGIFVVGFRYGGKQFQKSLRTSHKADAEGALHLVQHTIYELTTGLVQNPCRSRCRRLHRERRQ